MNFELVDCIEASIAVDCWNNFFTSNCFPLFHFYNFIWLYFKGWYYTMITIHETLEYSTSVIVDFSAKVRKSFTSYSGWLLQQSLNVLRMWWSHFSILHLHALIFSYIICKLLVLECLPTIQRNCALTLNFTSENIRYSSILIPWRSNMAGRQG